MGIGTIGEGEAACFWRGDEGKFPKNNNNKIRIVIVYGR